MYGPGLNAGFKLNAEYPREPLMNYQPLIRETFTHCFNFRIVEVKVLNSVTVFLNN